jgi:hypothetical protein
MFKRLLVAGIAALALGLVPAGPALAEDYAEGDLWRDGAGTHLASFDFYPDGERVFVDDEYRDDWGVLVELWWGGKLQRWCWNTNGYSDEVVTTEKCNFDIKDGTDITFYIALADKYEWKQCDPEDGCGKRKNFWAGQDNWGCNVTRDNEVLPCAEPDEASDFWGEA